ncbi:MAG: FHA domain-containing protein [Anaerolineae bacterium]|nr:FHA domain-containing protein [Anaerolineae bacterium]
MTDDSQSNQETSIIRGNASDPLNTIFERFMANYTPFGFHVQSEQVGYHALPYKPGEGEQILLPQPWRIILEMSTEERRMVMGLDLYGDVILGRGSSRPGRIIVDLEPYNAQAQGVSREHAMLRPTKTQLYVIDQGSTNGTTVNGTLCSRGIVIGLKNDNMLALGNMLLMVHILDKPDTAK